jgi:citrate lyase beta subunit
VDHHPGPADRPVRGGQTSGTDVAVVDLEDSVAPLDKLAARTTAQQFFDRPDAPCALGLRMNSPTTLEGVRDLVTITTYACKPALVVVPKLESARDIEIVAGALDADGYTPGIWALIETPRAFDKLPSILAAPRLGGVIFGSADYAAAVGCALGWKPLLYARSALVNSATAAGVPAIDAPVYDLHDLDGLRREAEQAKHLGFYGKAAVHPAKPPSSATSSRPPRRRSPRHAPSSPLPRRADGESRLSEGGWSALPSSPRPRPLSVR